MYKYKEAAPLKVHCCVHLGIILSRSDKCFVNFWHCQLHLESQVGTFHQEIQYWNCNKLYLSNYTMLIKNFGKGQYMDFELRLF